MIYFILIDHLTSVKLAEDKKNVVIVFFCQTDLDPDESIWQTRQMKRSGRPGRGNAWEETVRQTRRKKRSGRPVIKTRGSMTQVFEFKIIYPSLYQPVCLYVCLSISDNALNMKVYFGTAETTRQMNLVQVKIHVSL